VSFKSKKIKEKPYNPEFVKMVLERSENAKNGNTVPYTEELRKELFGDLLNTPLFLKKERCKI
jgi:hypothetical protein